MIVIVALAWAMIRYTVIDRQIIAAGDNEKAVWLTGIPSNASSSSFTW